MPSDDETAIGVLYHQMLAGWNQRSAEGFAAGFLDDGVAIGFDGSQHLNRAELVSDLTHIFADHPTGRYVGKIRSVRFLTPQVAVLRAVVGMVPAGRSDIEPRLNAVQSLVVVKGEGRWRIALLQTTPAQFHGRPELVDELAEELRRLL
jgi:uncharacterized protein (TIGR02246 family)